MPASIPTKLAILAVVVLLIEKLWMPAMPFGGALLLVSAWRDITTGDVRQALSSVSSDIIEGTTGGVSSSQEGRRLLLLLEPLCPISIDYGREADCMAQGVAALTNGSCPNHGLASNWVNHPSSAVLLPSVSDGCYVSKPHYKAAYTAMFRRALPTLSSLGWMDARVANFGSQAAAAALRDADVVMCTTKHYGILAPSFPCKKYVLIAPDDSATLEKGVDLGAANVLAVLQHTSFTGPAYNAMLPVVANDRLFKWAGDPQVEPGCRYARHCCLESIPALRLRLVEPALGVPVSTAESAAPAVAGGAVSGNDDTALSATALGHIQQGDPPHPAGVAHAQRPGLRWQGGQPRPPGAPPVNPSHASIPQAQYKSKLTHYPSMCFMTSCPIVSSVAAYLARIGLAAGVRARSAGTQDGAPR